MEDEIDEEVLQIVATMPHPRHAIFKAKELKEKGNKFFRNKEFQEAALTYDTAFQFLGAGEPLCEDDVRLMVEVGTSLGLNLAACSLKLGDFNQTLTFCQTVLDFDPLNVKALFRRATALVKLNRMEEAITNLQRAAELDPENKEVYKELQKAKKDLRLKTGKSRMEVVKCFSMEGGSNEEDNEGFFFNRSDKCDKEGSVVCPRSPNKEPITREVVDSMEIDGDFKLKDQEEGEMVDVGSQAARLQSAKNHARVEERSGEIQDREGVAPQHITQGPTGPSDSRNCHIVAKQTSMTCVEDRASCSSIESPANYLFSEGVLKKVKSTLKFSKRQDGQILSVNVEAYEGLLKGNHIEVFDPLSMTFMKVKVKIESKLPPPHNIAKVSAVEHPNSVQEECATKENQTAISSPVVPTFVIGCNTLPRSTKISDKRRPSTRVGKRGRAIPSGKTNYCCRNQGRLTHNGHNIGKGSTYLCLQEVRHQKRKAILMPTTEYSPYVKKKLKTFDSIMPVFRSCFIESCYVLPSNVVSSCNNEKSSNVREAYALAIGAESQALP